MKEENKKLSEICQVHKTMKVVGDYWLLALVYTLLGTPKRFNEIAEALCGISRRTLTLKLQKAEEAGILTKDEHKQREGCTTYALTPYGARIKNVLREIEKLSEK